MARSHVPGNIDYTTVIGGKRIVLRGVWVDRLTESSRILGAALRHPDASTRRAGFYVAGDACPKHQGREALLNGLGYTVSDGRVIWVAYSSGVPALSSSGESRLKITPMSADPYFVPPGTVLVDSSGGYNVEWVKFPTQVAATEWYIKQPQPAVWPYQVALKRWHRDAMERAVIEGFSLVNAYHWGGLSPGLAARKIEAAMKAEIGPLSAPPGLVWSFGSGLYGGLTGSADSSTGPVVAGLINPKQPYFPVALVMMSSDYYYRPSFTSVAVRCGYFGLDDAWCDHEEGSKASQWSSFHRHHTTRGGYINQALVRYFLRNYPST